MCTEFWLENLNGRYHLKDLGINKRMDITEVGVDWIHLA
jgi:hypothetical protein